MAIQLDKLDPVPFSRDEFSTEFLNWLALVIDALNSDLITIESFINLPVIQGYTQAQIVAAGPSALDGTLWYSTDSVPPNVVIKIDGALRQLTHTAYP